MVLKAGPRIRSRVKPPTPDNQVTSKSAEPEAQLNNYGQIGATLQARVELASSSEATLAVRMKICCHLAPGLYRGRMKNNRQVLGSGGQQHANPSHIRIRCTIEVHTGDI
eukprot:CAMPEP_0177537056 /NCGR_PEP_ID=MMETSP0369-20130122/57554_1 /TAXON_ID=447022 ORGANISM="Scrippsiella hangoei-like, Strain SHHI-4" /NCGR_SAMPLE_ID=MMETSP0369 /ASSEMBLY_ACC=CAM_ASM_000364 /LENGTH=109 /DNA_ID=CAMNT_0019019603 /DNA_START=34 /DNA_END=361 /DNA_ORIENTATION=+